MTGMTDEQLRNFRDRLLDMRPSIEEMLRQSAGERPVEASGSSIGRLSRMDAIQVQAMAQMGRRQLETKLLRVAAALKVMDEGTYGICRECREPVGVKRLEALPEAPFCVPCQEDLEK